MLKFLRHPMIVSRGHYLFLSLVIFMSLIEGMWDLYDWYRWDRILENCFEERLHRCDIGEAEVFITYNGDHGPDE